MFVCVSMSYLKEMFIHLIGGTKAPLCAWDGKSKTKVANVIVIYL